MEDIQDKTKLRKIETIIQGGPKKLATTR